VVSIALLLLHHSISEPLCLPHYYCYYFSLISVGDLMEAAMLIRKRNDESSLKLAALIADKAGAQELASVLANQSMKQSLLVGNWDVANEVAVQHPKLKVKRTMECCGSLLVSW
jgi:hypothetical protein